MTNDNLPFRIPLPKFQGDSDFGKKEGFLLDKLRKCEQELENSIINLAVFYSQMGRQDISMQYLNWLLAFSNSPEKKSSYYLKMGQLFEQIKDYQSAISFYTNALKCKPNDPSERYLLNNNLGYCLNQFSNFSLAEPFLRVAIQINPNRYNAYKNLGVSLEGQGEFSDAIEFYIKSTQLNAADSRAFQHLEKLLSNHPEIYENNLDLEKKFNQCRDAIILAKEFKNKLSKKNQ
jgi:tetratricopeptide (TPR) repeat protein